MSALGIIVTNEIAPKAILALFEGFTKDPVRGRLKSVQAELNDKPLPVRVFRH
jgi:hypothetical protein